MKLLSEERKGFEHIFKVQVEYDFLSQKVSEKLISLTKKVHIHGFRLGKVPFSLLQKKYGNSILSEVIENVLSDSSKKILERKKIPNVIDVRCEIVSSIRQKPLLFNVYVHTFPDFNPDCLYKKEILQPEVSLNNNHVNIVIQNILNEHALWNIVERAISLNDLVTIEHTCFSNDKKVIDSLSSKNLEFLVGKNKTPLDIDSSVIGMSAGEEKLILTKVLDKNSDYYDQLLKVNISIKIVKEKKLPDINSDFMEKINFQGDSKDFSNTIRKSLLEQINVSSYRKIKLQIFDLLDDSINIKLPLHLLQEEIMRLKKKSMVENLSDKYQDFLEEEANRSVKLSLIFQQIVKQENFQIDKDSVIKKIGKYFGGDVDTLDLKNHILKNKKELEKIRLILLEEKVIDFIKSFLKISNKKEDFFDFIGISTESKNVID